MAMNQMQQVVDGAGAQRVGGAGADMPDGGMDAKMLDMMTQMRAMMDEMIQMMQGEGKAAGFASVDREQGGM